MNKYVPLRHTARAATGSLAKLLLWNKESPLVVDEDGTTSREVVCHQSDYISTMLMHQGLADSSSPIVTTTSDWHNCLKLGYDVRKREYPIWLHELLQEGCGVSSETFYHPMLSHLDCPLVQSHQLWLQSMASHRMS